MDFNSTLNQSISQVAQCANITPPQFVAYAHNLTATPALIILFIVTHLLFLIIGMSLVDKKKKLLTIWVITFLLSGMMLLILIYLPNTTQQIVGYLK
jgi:hypothetical protein